MQHKFEKAAQHQLGLLINQFNSIFTILPLIDAALLKTISLLISIAEY
jgi:hypothetical protein